LMPALGLVTNPRATPAAIECREWLIKRIADGDQILVPEIADYEIRRELLSVAQIGLSFS
jgi:hypothetical protein